MISRVYRALDWPSSMSGTKVMAQKNHFTPISEHCNCMHWVSHWRHFDFLYLAARTC